MQQNYVWYAAYDQDLKRQTFEDRMKKIYPDFEVPRAMAVQIKGW